LFRTLGVPHRLAYIVEGESLFNDAVAVVIFGIVSGVVASTTLNPAQGIPLSQVLITGVLQFLRVSAGGVALGALVGYVVAQVMQRLDDYLIEVTLTTILAYGTFLVAEQLHHAYTMTGQRLSQEIQKLVEQHQEVQRRELEQAQREALRAERSALNELVRRGQISEEVYRQLVSDVDRRMASLDERD